MLIRITGTLKTTGIILKAKLYRCKISAKTIRYYKSEDNSSYGILTKDKLHVVDTIMKNTIPGAGLIQFYAYTDDENFKRVSKEVVAAINTKFEEIQDAYLNLKNGIEIGIIKE